MAAYVRRTTFEARVMASQIGRLFGGENHPKREDAKSVLGMIGIDW
jgi:hypothetical protein